MKDDHDGKGRYTSWRSMLIFLQIEYFVTIRRTSRRREVEENPKHRNKKPIPWNLILLADTEQTAEEGCLITVRFQM